MWTEVARADDVAPGGVKYVRVGEEEIAVCNVGGAFYAVGRRCGHMNAPLEQGCLDGRYLVCPLHHVQFDVTSGKAVSGPVDHDMGSAEPPEPYRRWWELKTRLEWKIRVHDLPTYPVRVSDGAVEVQV